MIGAKRQFFSSIFARGSRIKLQLEMARFADKNAVGGNPRAIQIGNNEAEFSRAILCADECGKEQQYNRGVYKSGSKQNTAQVNSPGLPGNASLAMIGWQCLNVFYSRP